jgi:hypothetical protein
MKPLKERVEELGICLYRGGFDEDILVAQWWDSLAEERSNLVSSSAYNLSSFLNLFQPPNMMCYTVADDEMESVHWVEPVATSDYTVFFSSWSAKELRGTRRHLALMKTVYELVFNLGKKTILGITKQQKLLELHSKIGYVVFDPVPHLFDHDPAWIMYLTKESFETSRMCAVADKIEDKE